MKRKKKAFTLVELLVVIVIIGILVALLYPAVTMARKAGQDAKEKQERAEQYYSVPVYCTNCDHSGPFDFKKGEPVREPRDEKCPKCQLRTLRLLKVEREKPYGGSK